MWEYVVGGVIGTAGTAFAFFNGWVSVRDDRQREADEHAAPVRPHKAEQHAA
jgi:hypothetical protein